MRLRIRWVASFLALLVIASAMAYLRFRAQLLATGMESKGEVGDDFSEATNQIIANLNISLWVLVGATTILVTVLLIRAFSSSTRNSQ